MPIALFIQKSFVPFAMSDTPGVYFLKLAVFFTICAAVVPFTLSYLRGIFDMSSSSVRSFPTYQTKCGLAYVVMSHREYLVVRPDAVNTAIAVSALHVASKKNKIDLKIDCEAVIQHLTSVGIYTSSHYLDGRWGAITPEHVAAFLRPGPPSKDASVSFPAILAEIAASGPFESLACDFSDLSAAVPGTVDAAVSPALLHAALLKRVSAWQWLSLACPGLRECLPGLGAAAVFPNDASAVVRSQLEAVAALPFLSAVKPSEPPAADRHCGSFVVNKEELHRLISGIVLYNKEELVCTETRVSHGMLTYVFMCLCHRPPTKGAHVPQVSESPVAALFSPLVPLYAGGTACSASIVVRVPLAAAVPLAFFQVLGQHNCSRPSSFFAHFPAVEEVLTFELANRTRNEAMTRGGRAVYNAFVSALIDLQHLLDGTLPGTGQPFDNQRAGLVTLAEAPRGRRAPTLASAVSRLARLPSSTRPVELAAESLLALGSETLRASELEIPREPAAESCADVLQAFNRFEPAEFEGYLELLDHVGVGADGVPDPRSAASKFFLGVCGLSSRYTSGRGAVTDQDTDTNAARVRRVGAGGNLHVGFTALFGTLQRAGWAHFEHAVDAAGTVVEWANWRLQSPQQRAFFEPISTESAAFMGVGRVLQLDDTASLMMAAIRWYTFVAICPYTQVLLPVYNATLLRGKTSQRPGLEPGQLLDFMVSVFDELRSTNLRAFVTVLVVDKERSQWEGFLRHLQFSLRSSECAADLQRLDRLLCPSDSASFRASASDLERAREYLRLYRFHEHDVPVDVPAVAHGAAAGDAFRAAADAEVYAAARKVLRVEWVLAVDAGLLRGIMELLRLELNSCVYELRHVSDWPGYAKVLHRLLSSFAHIMPADVRAPLRRFFSWYLDHRVQLCVWHKLKNTISWKEKIGLSDDLYETLMEYVYKMEYARTEAEYLEYEGEFLDHVNGLAADATAEPDVIGKARLFYDNYMQQFGTGSECEGLCNRYARRDFYQWIDASQTVESLHWVKKGTVLERWLRRRDGGWVLYRFVGAPSEAGVDGITATSPGGFRQTSAAAYGTDTCMVSHLAMKRNARLAGYKPVVDRDTPRALRAQVQAVLLRNEGASVALLRPTDFCKANGIFSVFSGTASALGTQQETRDAWIVNVAANRCTCFEVHSCKHVHACRIFIMDQLRADPSCGLVRMWVDTDSETLAPRLPVVLSKVRGRAARTQSAVPSAPRGGASSTPAAGAGTLPRTPAGPEERHPNLDARSRTTPAQAKRRAVSTATSAIVREMEEAVEKGINPDAKMLQRRLAAAIKAAKALAAANAAAAAEATDSGSDGGSSAPSTAAAASGVAGAAARADSDGGSGGASGGSVSLFSNSDSSDSDGSESRNVSSAAATSAGVLPSGLRRSRRLGQASQAREATAARIRYERFMAQKYPLRNKAPSAAPKR